MWYLYLINDQFYIQNEPPNIGKIFFVSESQDEVLQKADFLKNLIEKQVKEKIEERLKQGKYKTLTEILFETSVDDQIIKVYFTESAFRWYKLQCVIDDEVYAEKFILDKPSQHRIKVILEDSWLRVFYGGINLTERENKGTWAALENL